MRLILLWLSPNSSAAVQHLPMAVDDDDDADDNQNWSFNRSVKRFRIDLSWKRGEKNGYMFCVVIVNNK